MACFSVLRQIQSLDPERDHQRIVFLGKNDELPSREGAPGGLDRASGFPFPL